MASTQLTIGVKLMLSSGDGSSTSADGSARGPATTIFGDDVVTRLRELRRAAETRDDPDLADALRATESVAVEWLAQRSDVAQQRAQLSAASAVELRTRDRLRGLVRMLLDASDVPRMRANANLSPPLATTNASDTATPADPLPRAHHARVVPRRGSAVEPVESNVTAHGVAALMFGQFRLFQNGQLINSFPAGQMQALLRYLIAHRQQATPKDVLMELLWPDGEPQSSSRNLHQAVYALRRQLRQAQPNVKHVIFRHDCYQFDPSLDLWCDVDAFDNAVAMGYQHESNRHVDAALHSYRMAVSLVTGAFLADAPYEPWATTMRERLRLKYLDVGVRLSQMELEGGRPEQALTVSRQLLEHDSGCESAHRCAMRSYDALGSRDLAIEQYRMCSQLLADEYGIDPSPATLAVYRAIMAGTTSPHHMTERNTGSARGGVIQPRRWPL